MQKVLTIAVAALALAVGTSGALAQGKGKSGGSPSGPSLQGTNTLPNWDKGERKGWKEGDTPPGWTNELGQRRGWNGQNVPPGFQAR